MSSNRRLIVNRIAAAEIDLNQILTLFSAAGAAKKGVPTYCRRSRLARQLLPRGQRIPLTDLIGLRRRGDGDEGGDRAARIDILLPRGRLKIATVPPRPMGLAFALRRGLFDLRSFMSDASLLRKANPVNCEMTKSADQKLPQERGRATLGHPPRGRKSVGTPWG